MLRCTLAVLKNRLLPSLSLRLVEVNSMKLKAAAKKIAGTMPKLGFSRGLKKQTPQINRENFQMASEGKFYKAKGVKK